MERGIGMKHWSEKLPQNACDNAIRWCRTQPNIKTAWETCERGDWMLWQLAQNVKQGSTLHRKIVLMGCECARLSLKYVTEGDKRPLMAIETAEAWARREKGVTLKEVLAAADAADAAYAAADAADAAHAAHAAHAADAADAAYAAADAADAAADAADAAYAAADAAAHATAHARWVTLKKCADIVRKHFSIRDVYKVLKRS